MDIWTATWTFLEKNPGIKSKELFEYVKKKVDRSRSTIFENWEHFINQGKICRERGRYWLGEKPGEINSSKLVELSKKIEELEKQVKQEQLSETEKYVLKLRREDAADTEIMNLKRDDSEFLKKKQRILKKYELL